MDEQSLLVVGSRWQEVIPGTEPRQVCDSSAPEQCDLGHCIRPLSSIRGREHNKVGRIFSEGSLSNDDDKHTRAENSDQIA